MNGEFQSQPIVLNSADDVYRRWLYFATETGNTVGFVDDVIVAPLLAGETYSSRLALWVTPPRGPARRIRVRTGHTVELAAPHHVNQWLEQKEAALVRDRRTAFAGVPTVIGVAGVALGLGLDVLLGSGVALTLTFVGLGVVAATVVAALHDSTIRTQSAELVRGKFRPAAIDHLAVLNQIAADKARRLAEEEAARAAAEAAAEADTAGTETTDPDHHESTEDPTP